MDYTVQYIGHTKNIAYIKQLIAKQCLPAAWLWLGEEQLGKFTLAINLAYWLMCSDKRDNNPCGHCVSCLTLHNNTNSNLIVIKPKQSNKITKADVQQYFQALHHTNLNHTIPRLVIIDPITALTEEAINALLKILEEPISNVYFILLARQQQMVMATIRSRCALLNFYPVWQSEKIKPAWLTLADGLPGRALLFNNVVERKQLDILTKRWAAIFNTTSFSQRLALYKQYWPTLSETEFLQQHFPVITELCRQVCLWLYQVPIKYTWSQVELEQLANKYSTKYHIQRILKLAELRKQLLQHCQFKLIIEQLMLNLYYSI
ncbi:MAG: hypothetical protein WCW27_05575 [Patescibacteria group bacterium]|jgi:hypothetical protein